MTPPGDSERSAGERPVGAPAELSGPKAPGGAAGDLSAAWPAPDAGDGTALPAPSGRWPASRPPVTKADARWWILFAALGFLLGQIVGLIFTVVLADLLGKGQQLSTIAKMAAPPEWYIGAGLVGLWVGFFLAPVMASRIRGTGHLVVDLGLRFRPVDLFGLLIGFAGQELVTILYSPFVRHLKNFQAPVTKLTGGSHGGGFLVIAILTVVGAPFFEELFFRGLLFAGLLRLCTPGRPAAGVARGLGVVGAVVADGLLFALAHAELEQLAGLALFGAVLAYVVYRTGRLGMAMVSHASFNLIAVLYIVVNRSGGVIH